MKLGHRDICKAELKGASAEGIFRTRQIDGYDGQSDFSLFFEWEMNETQTRYRGLRNELDRLRHQFACERADHSRLFAQRFWDAEHLSDGGWEAFANRASCPRSWEEWHVLAGGEGLIRFCGDQKAFYDFARLAESGWLALAALEQSVVPGLVTLGDDDLLCGWVTAVFETALAAMTPTLWLKYERWGITSDEYNVNKFDPAYWHDEGDRRHPAHPFTQTLSRDIFISSADAIACWLDPDNVLTVGPRLDDLPIRLPSLDGPHRDIAAQTENTTMTGTDELSTRDAAAFLKVSIDTLNAHVRGGQLPRRNVSPHGSSRGPFLYKVADLIKLREGAYQRTVQKGAPKPARKIKTTPPPEPDYDHLDL